MGKVTVRCSAGIKLSARASIPSLMPSEQLTRSEKSAAILPVLFTTAMSRPISESASKSSTCTELTSPSDSAIRKRIASAFRVRVITELRLVVLVYATYCLPSDVEYGAKSPNALT